MKTSIDLLNDLIDHLDEGAITEDRFVASLREAGLELQSVDWIDDCCGGYAYRRYDNGVVYAETTPYGWICGMVAKGH